MGFFGFSSKKENEKKARERVIAEQQSSLGNLGKGSQVNFAIPFFDIFDPRFSDFGVPVSVHGSLVYVINDINRFNQINKGETFNDAVFEKKLKGELAKYIKNVVCNAPAQYQIQVLQIERKILEISNLIQTLVTPQIENLFGINVRSLNVERIMVDKSSRGYRELKSVTSDLEGDAIRMRSSLNLDAMKRQQEMSLGGQEEMQRMQLENQKEIMRIQREEMQRGARLQTETNFLSAHQANLNAQVGVAQGMGLNAVAASMQQQAQAQAMGMPSMPSMPQMPGMPPMPGMEPQVQYMVNVNNQPYGPCDWKTLQQLVQTGQLTHQTPVWKQGMAQWEHAGTIQELTPLFNGGGM